MNTLPETILRHARSRSEGGVLSPKEFLHLGSRSAVDQAFSRLAKVGMLLRVARGAYAAPIPSRFGSRAPAPGKVVKALAERSGEIVVPHGASAANVLGLTRQVPVREVYLTSGPTRKLKFGGSEVLVKHAPRWMLALGARPAGAAVRALAWIGSTHAGESLANLHRSLPRSEWQALVSARAMLPAWMAQAIGEEAARD
ncbi:MAG: type IV toxin-antitoxin system AbiEi family antitoxin domain-containing protein [Candidatus Accumulibacter sp.]|nr:type IV toxin-antitoxin system AbiEi family antitoxin domain-containing protein [Accumulibacter sp.]